MDIPASLMAKIAKVLAGTHKAAAATPVEKL